MKRGAQAGNRNAAKPAEERRVTLSLRVQPQTRARLEELAQIHGSMGAAVDHLATASSPPDALPLQAKYFQIS